MLVGLKETYFRLHFQKWTKTGEGVNISGILPAKFPGRPCFETMDGRKLLFMSAWRISLGMRPKKNIENKISVWLRTDKICTSRYLAVEI